MKKLILITASLSALALLVSACYVHHPSYDARTAPPQGEQHGAHEGEEDEYGGEEGEVPPPAPGSDEEYYDEEPAQPPVHPGPTW